MNSKNNKKKGKERFQKLKIDQNLNDRDLTIKASV